jgi:hypothetical protein
MWFPLLSLAFAADLVPVQGYAAGPDGAPLHGLHTIGFRLVRDEAGSDLAWSGAQEVVFDRGVFSALVGAGSPALDYAVFAEPGSLWVQLDIGGVLSDAAPIGRAPRAAHALWADSAASVGTIEAAEVATQGDVSTLNAAISAVDGALSTLEDVVDGLATLADTTSNNLSALALDHDDRLVEVEGEVSLLAPGMIAFFPGACPAGWAEYTALRGRVAVGIAAGGPVATPVGTALGVNGTRQITDVPAHAHTVDPPSTTSGGESAGHTHAVDPPSTTSGGQSADHSHTVDPPNAGTTTNGSHNHIPGNAFETMYIMLNPNGGYPTPTGPNVGGARMAAAYAPDSGSHSHTVDIGAFGTSGASASHTHNTDISAFTSGSASVGHTHSTDIAAFTSGATGVSGVDVTMPYLSLVPCQIQ